MTHSNQPIEEFLEEVRFRAAQSGAPPALIDKLDECLGFSTQEADLEKLGGELADMEELRDDSLNALRNLVDALPDNAAELCEDRAIDRVLSAAKQVLAEQNA